MSNTPGRSGSGRGRPTGRGNSGRGFYRGPKKEEKVEDYKFYPHGSGKYQQTKSYESVKHVIVHYILRTLEDGDDVANSLTEMKVKDFDDDEPVRRISVLPDAESRKVEQDGFDIRYQAQLQGHLDAERKYIKNMTKTYAIIFDTFCNKTMRNRIEEHPEYANMKGDPIQLLRAIQVLMYDPIRARYPFATLTDALLRVLELKQQENEGLLDYVKRFKQQADIFKSHVGQDVLHNFVQLTDEYKSENDADEQQRMLNKSFGRWMSYILLRNSDKKKYESIIDGMTSQFSMKNDQFPKSVTDTVDIMSNHKYDNKKATRPRTSSSGGSNANNNRGNNATPSTGTSFAQNRTVTCYCCGRQGHTSPECPERNTRPYSEWHRRPRGNRRGNSGNHEAWSGLTFGQLSKTKDQLKEYIILDTGSTVSIFTNPELVRDRREGEKTLVMTTNAGKRESNEVATVDGFGKVWFIENGMANIFGFADLKKKYRITYDSSIEDAFTVYTPNGKIKFSASPEGLYHCAVTDE